MSKPPEEHRVDDPAEAMERMRSAMRQIVTVSKPEILRREAEAMKQRRAKRKQHGQGDARTPS